MPDFDALSFLASFAATPTAPFREHLVMHRVDTFAQQYRALRTSRDDFGNTLVVRPGKRRRKPRLIFVAHLDHPGFVAREMIDDRTLHADFRGGVFATLMSGARATFFEADREIAAKILTTEADADGRCTSATLRVADAVSPDAIGMFALEPGPVKGKRFHGRACDDLAGAAAALVMLAGLAKSAPAADVGVLLTRGEEMGFIGAIASCMSPTLLKSDDRIISVECSVEQPVALQGNGVVLRVGDRTSVFNSAFSRFIFDCAQSLESQDKNFRYQRALMPGGTCEATAFDAWGYVAGAICVPLGNYHNMDKERGRIAAEHVHVDDWLNMIKLFEAVARGIHSFDGTHETLRSRLSERFEKHRSLLTVRGTMHAGACDGWTSDQ